MSSGNQVPPSPQGQSAERRDVDGSKRGVKEDNTPPPSQTPIHSHEQQRRWIIHFEGKCLVPLAPVLSIRCPACLWSPVPRAGRGWGRVGEGGGGTNSSSYSTQRALSCLEYPT